LSELLDEHELPGSDVNNIRLPICYSTRGGEHSLASEISVFTHLRVKGYVNKLNMWFDGYGNENVVDVLPRLIQEGKPVPPLVLYKPGHRGWRYYLSAWAGAIEPYGARTFSPRIPAI
jgi:hypothetical protein